MILIRTSTSSTEKMTWREALIEVVPWSKDTVLGIGEPNTIVDSVSAVTVNGML